MKILKTTIAALLFSASVFAQEATLTVTTEGTGFRVKPAVTAEAGKTILNYKIIISYDGDFQSADGYTVVSNADGLLTLKTVSWWSPTSYTSIVFNNTTIQPVINGVYATLTDGQEIFIGDEDPDGNGTNVVSIPGEFWLKNGSSLIMDQSAITGNVGIGTNTPEEKLHVEGNVLTNALHLTQTSGIAGSNGTKTSTGYVRVSTGGGVVSPQLQLNLDGGEHMALFANGVGIGDLTGVSEKLQVDGNIKSKGIRLFNTSSIQGSNSTFTKEASIDVSTGGGVVSPRMTIQFDNYQTSNMKLFPGGVGIGELNGVSEKLEVAGNVKSEGLMLTNTSSMSGGNGQFTVNGNIDVSTGGGVAAPRMTMKFGSSNDSKIQLFNSGVSIGDVSYVPSGYSLAVNGKVICEELKVQLSQDWPDYVFADNYELMSLEELQKYVDQNDHLPNIPAASEMKENGISVSDMNVKLMEKVEELTLYILKMNKEIEALKK